MEKQYIASTFQLAIDARVELAETPIWDERIGRWYWTNLFNGDVHRYDPVSGTDEVFPTNKLIGSAIPTTDVNKLLVSLEDGIHLLDLNSGKLSFIADPENGNPNNRYNDTRVDARGRVFMSSVSKLYGTKDYSPDMKGGFYMVEPDGHVHTIETSINQYNCMVWNHDDTKLYVVDTYNHTLLSYEYDINKGVVSPAKIVITFGELGMPDGISIDVEDNLYICHWTGQLSIWNSQLTLIKTVPFPVEYVCCGGFGGEGYKDFYVASSKYCYTDAELAKNPGAGGIFVARTDIQGTPDHFYRV